MRAIGHGALCHGLVSQLSPYLATGGQKVVVTAFTATLMSPVAPAHACRPRNKGGQHGEVCGGDASGDAIVCYHQTSPENAQAILQSGRMKRGPKGFGGRGIYFAEDPQVGCATPSQRSQGGHTQGRLQPCCSVVQLESSFRVHFQSATARLQLRPQPRQHGCIVNCWSPRFPPACSGILPREHTALCCWVCTAGHQLQGQPQRGDPGVRRLPGACQAGAQGWRLGRPLAAAAVPVRQHRADFPGGRH